MMSEMEKEEEEEVSLSHFIHDHPLTLIQSDKGNKCNGCGLFFLGEAAYGCKECGNEKILHEGCGEMPKEIRHPMHPQHTMVQEIGNDSKSCAVCKVKMWRNDIGYFCTSPDCDFQLHLACTPAVGVEKVGDEPTCIKHPSHPQHQLFLLRKRHTFKCDACGSIETGRSYGCLPCEYWIHERCATLLTTSDYHHYHDHPPLLLAFNLPPARSKFTNICDVCRKNLPINRWMYHCQMCRYTVHIKCAIKLPQLPETSSDNADAVDAQGAIQFPCSQFHEEVIKPFVIREKGEMMMPRHDQKYMFPTHPHQLSLVSSSISEVKDDEDDDDDDDLDSCGQISELICDACTTPISSSSSSPSLDYNKYYMSCGECKYFLHLACFNLPPKLSPHPLHKTDHTLILQACSKLDLHTKYCSMCNFPMNGLIYSCRECGFKADIKCISVPSTIKHGSHPHHHLHSKFWAKEEYIKGVMRGYCSGCNSGINWGMLYECGNCDFTLCLECVTLPPVNKHECDKHPLPLRYDAYLSHTGDFYCDSCEREINPNDWMYHCLYCDTFFHTRCFPATSGQFRNIKFGQQYNVPHALHPHPLTFQLLATKLRCDVCRLRVYGEANVDQRGFHCSSCNFFMCFHRCGEWRLHAMSLID